MKIPWAPSFLVLTAFMQAGFTQSLFVDPAGSDANNGLTPDRPLRTIAAALGKMSPDSLHPGTIHLAAGVFSPSTNGESYPLRLQGKNYLALSGAGELHTILDAERTSVVLEVDSCQNLAIQGLAIQNGASDDKGGGISSVASIVNVAHVTVSKNTASWGGGIYCAQNSRLNLDHVTISDNQAKFYDGGGIFCFQAEMTLKNSRLFRNAASDGGGGIHADDSRLSLTEVQLSRNRAAFGGGIACQGISEAQLALSSVTIRENTAHNVGGGIYFEDFSAISFDPAMRSNICLNNAGYQGNDLYAEPSVPLINVVVDTFTVMNPTEYNAYPGTSFAFDILQAKAEKVRSDLYVSPHGSNANNGLSPSAPLRTISFALAKVEADHLAPRTIHLADGVYSPSQNGELFPLNMLSYVSLSGESREGVILNAERQSSVLFLEDDQVISVANMTITQGDYGYGGGIHCYYSSLALSHVSLWQNRSFEGGGMKCVGSNLNLTRVDIKYNAASFGGGIFLYSSQMSFNRDTRCNIFLNSALSGGNDLYTRDEDGLTNVVVDTFTVMAPDDYHAYPVHRFTFDILHAKIAKVDEDLYVSPDGDNANSGLSSSDPLQTISHALQRIRADSLHPHTLYLAKGVYSPSTNGETFPLSMSSYISLSGESKEAVILNAEGRESVLFFDGVQGTRIENLTLTGGVSYYGGGIYCEDSKPRFENITVIGNTAEHSGGGIYCIYSEPTFSTMVVSGNRASQRGGGISLVGFEHAPILKNVTVSGNSAGNFAGGIECEGIDPILVNVTITMNSSEGISCHRVNLTLINSILWNNSSQEISLVEGSTAQVFYCNVQGGWQGQSNINADPLFAGPEIGDFHLSANSPCIDRGTSFFVWQGDTLVNLSPDQYYGHAPDLGSYEYVPASSIDHRARTPMRFTLSQNFPNPFNPSTAIHYTLPTPAKVLLKVYDLLGREIATLIDETKEAGAYDLQWQPLGLPSGVYVYRLQAGEFSATKALVLLR